MPVRPMVATMSELSREEAEAFVKAVVDLAAMADRALPRRTSPLRDRLVAHLGDIGGDLSSTAATWPAVEQVNLQLALNAYEREDSPLDVVGMSANLGNYGDISLTSIITGEWHGPGESARHYAAVEIDVDETIDCLKAGLFLTAFDGTPVVALMYTSDHGPMREVMVEVVGATEQAADGFLRRLKALMHEHNAFRGKTVAFTFGMRGEFGLSFIQLPAVVRDDVILPEGELRAIESHAIGISEAADELRAAGQHVKRGLLLYGSPGTGKTHTIAYLTNMMQGRTTIVLTGGATRAVGQAGTIARELQPATIVIEDVDLIAMDRHLPGGEHNAVLFQLLNEMDGLAEDADVLFILTTNRVDMLEAALAARPGRIDQAVEVSLPNAEGRRRLVKLYAGLDLAEDDELIERLGGVAPAFIKELARRAELIRLQRPDPSASEMSVALPLALDAMFQQSTPILRRTLAAASDPFDDEEPLHGRPPGGMTHGVSGPSVYPGFGPV